MNEKQFERLLAMLEAIRLAVFAAQGWSDKYTDPKGLATASDKLAAGALDKN